MLGGTQLEASMLSLLYKRNFTHPLAFILQLVYKYATFPRAHLQLMTYFHYA
jgi:hypothetical protein